MNTVKLWLINNSTVDLKASDAELPEMQQELNAVLVDPNSIYTAQIQGGLMHIPGRNIIFYQVIPPAAAQE